MVCCPQIKEGSSTPRVIFNLSLTTPHIKSEAQIAISYQLHRKRKLQTESLSTLRR